MTTFTEFNLHPNINKAIEACGYTKPTPVQAQSIPEVLQDRDVVVSAQTGTGKTAAFVLPALHKLSQQKPNKKTRVLILTPTRELATQITKAASLYGKFLRFNIVSLVGGMSYHHQIRDLQRGADIIVATPGRLLDHIDQKRVDLSHVEMLVLDEADRMLDMGFIEDVQYIAKLTPEKRQTLLFSATLDSKLMNAVKHLLKNPARIDLSVETISAPSIKQELYKVNSPQQKTRLLKHFLADENIYKAIIFSATKIMADKLAHQLRDDGFAAAPLHGDLRQNVRNRTLEQLRHGKIQFLVATDVAARGIDVSDITHVFNYDLPRFCEDYVHRIGRTGRAGKTGVAISFVMPSDARNVKSIERFIGKRINLINFDMNKIADAPRREVVETEEEVEILTLKKGSKFSGEKRERHFDGEQRRRKFGGKKENKFGDKKERRFDGKREDRFGSKKERGFSGDREDRFDGKKERRFGSKREDRLGSKTERSFSGDREDRFEDKKERRFDGKREDRFGSKKERSFGGERAGRFEGKKERRFDSKREDRFGDRKERRFSDKKDNKFGARKERFADKSERGFGEKKDRSGRDFSAKKKRPFAEKTKFHEKRDREFLAERKSKNNPFDGTRKKDRAESFEGFSLKKKRKGEYSRGS